ncbi:MAG: protein jag [Clostridiales bacterium]|nr:protein jag [Clostridiales bacterium]
MRSVETTGKTIEEAVLSAVAQLGVPRDRLEIEIVEEPEKGILGIFGRKNAVVQASKRRTQAEMAEHFLEGLFKNMQIAVDIDIRDRGDLLSIELSGNNMGLVIGYRGETLDAIQYLVSLVANSGEDRYKKVIIDTEGYRKKREETLKRLSRRLAHRVEKTKKRVVLEPMNPYERRVIHSTLQYKSHISTYSEGEEPYRRVVIDLK